MNVPVVACLLGPTASGKTATALEVARRRAAEGQQVEIISIDSALVYREMDIGTAKPTLAERQGVPHPLIDIRDPRDAYPAAEFCADTHRLIDAIHARGALPLLVGGTMLYYRALTQGLAQLPGADAAVRAALDAEALEHGWPALHARLALHDPVTAARLAPNDAQRIQRALEVWMLSGEPLSTWIDRQHAAKRSVTGRVTAVDGAVDTASVDAFGRGIADGVNAPLTDTMTDLDNGAAHSSANSTIDASIDFVPISLEPSDRAVLHRRIEARFDAMLANGLLDEVARLKARGDLSPALPSIRCVGYRQVWDYLDGQDDYRGMRDKGVFATRQLCKRQLTWLRGFHERQVIDCCAPDAVDLAATAVEALWGLAETSPGNTSRHSTDR